jgi:glycosyltransferase involved in cell wall biosynthesis
VKNKSICALTLHDEPPAYFPQFKNIYSSEIAYCFSTIEEWKTYETVFHSSPETYSIIGVNVDIPEVKTTQTHPNPYIVYIGRIDGGKGIEQLLEYYSYWKTLAQEVPDLVLLGGGKPPDLIPNGVHFKGFVTLEEKVSYLSNSLFLVNPSPMESFSIVLMEAWLLNKPVLVNGNCDTMKNHCLRSNGGLFFKDSESFAATANFLLQNPNIREKMSVNGNQYVKMNFSKEMIKSKLLNLIKRRIAKY